MIHYHGTPITPDLVIAEAMRGAHFCVSYHRPDQLALVAEVGASFFVDNGAFSKWREEKRAMHSESHDWSVYYEWLKPVMRLPGFDFAVIPDVIEGSEEDNAALLDEWPHGKHVGAPVWHLHESLEYLQWIVAAGYTRVCFGSSGEFAEIGTDAWWRRMHEAMQVVCDSDGLPKVKLHGLRMLDPEIVEAFPFASCGSTNVARNIGIDSRWKGTYAPPTKAARAAQLRQRIERALSPTHYTPKRSFLEQGAFF